MRRPLAFGACLTLAALILAYILSNRLNQERPDQGLSCSTVPFLSVVASYRASLKGKGKRSVLVTGVAGFIGSHVADFCQNSIGFHVVGVDDMSRGFMSNIKTFTAGGGQFVVGNLGDKKFVDALFHAHGPFDHVFHLAAFAGPGLSHFVRQSNYQINLVASVLLINAAIQQNPQVLTFVFTSSIAAHGSSDGVLPLTERSPQLPEDPYGIAKLSVELDLKAAHHLYGLKFIIFRPHNVYGPRQNIVGKFRNVVGIFIHQILRGQSITVFGNGQQRRAFSYIDDVAPLVAASPLFPQAYGEDFFVGPDTQYSILELSNAVQAAMQTSGSATFLDSSRNEVQSAYAVHTKVRCIFNPSPPTDLREGLRKTALFVKTHGPFEQTGHGAIEVCKELPQSWWSWLNLSDPVTRARICGRSGSDLKAYSDTTSHNRLGLGLPPDEDTVFDRMSVDDRTPPSLLTLDPGTRKHSEFDLAGNNAVQQKFWDLQHPADCHNARFLILSEYHHSGIGSTLHIRALQFMLGMDTNRVVIDDPGIVWDHTSTQKEYCASTGFDCYFLPLSHCSIPMDFKKEARRVNSIDHVYGNDRRVFVDNMEIFFRHYGNLVDLQPKKFGAEFVKSGHWWMAQVIRYLVRPNKLTVDNIIKPSIRSVFPSGVPRGMASVFVRWGDKGKEMTQLEDVEAHFRPLLLIPSITHVYVGSDSQKAIYETIAKYGDHFKLYFLNVSRAYDGAGHAFAEYREKLGNREIVEQMKINLMQLYLSVQGDVMSGELASNWCRLEHELHDALGKSHFQYFQVGNCSESDYKCVGT